MLKLVVPLVLALHVVVHATLRLPINLEAQSMQDLRFPYYTNRWGRPESLTLIKTPEGWHLQKIAHSGPCAPDGSPHLIGNFDQDYVSYPIRIGMYLEHIWEQLHCGEIDGDRAQEMLNDLGRWVAECEQAAPRWKGWNA